MWFIFFFLLVSFHISHILYVCFFCWIWLDQRIRKVGKKKKKKKKEEKGGSKRGGKRKKTEEGKKKKKKGGCRPVKKKKTARHSSFDFAPFAVFGGIFPPKEVGRSNNNNNNK
jgi:hypothetical protein